MVINGSLHIFYRFFSPSAGCISAKTVSANPLLITNSGQRKTVYKAESVSRLSPALQKKKKITKKEIVN